MASVSTLSLSPALSPLVAGLHYHESEGVPTLERILPGGRVHLMVNLHEDEAHLVHDFRELTGITPTAYRPRSIEERNHVPVSPG